MPSSFKSDVSSFFSSIVCSFDSSTSDAGSSTSLGSTTSTFSAEVSERPAAPESSVLFRAATPSFMLS